MAARLGTADQQRLARQGFELMPADQALAALDELRLAGRPQALVLAVDWPAYARQHPSGAVPPLLQTVAAGAGGSARPAAARAPTGIRETLRAAPPNRVRALLLAHLREQAVRVLGLAAGRQIDPRQPLQELGLDSLMAVELRNVVGASLGRTLSATLLFDYPTLDALTDFLLADRAPAGTPAPAAAAPANDPAAAVAAVAQLSEAEAEALLLEELAQLKQGPRHD